MVMADFLPQVTTIEDLPIATMLLCISAPTYYKHQLITNYYTKNHGSIVVRNWEEYLPHKIKVWLAILILILTFSKEVLHT